jgi:CubicO group peptidase (beta-lactamase class C family)
LITLNTLLSDIFSILKTFPAGNISVLSLLTHTSGLPQDMFNCQNLENLLLALQNFIPAPSPGYNYSNVGYVILKYILENIYQDEYCHILKDLILTPLKMDSTFITGIDNPYPENTSIGYTYTDGVYRRIPQSYNYDNKYGFGAIQTTSSDFFKYLQANTNPNNSSYDTFNGCRQILVTTNNGHQVGYGWEYINGAWVKGGAVPGYSSGIVIYNGKGSFCLSNMASVNCIKICRKLLGANYFSY